MDITILVNQVLIMRALMSVTTDEDLRAKLRYQIQFTEARIKASQ